MKRAIVAGSTGTIGRALAARLRTEGREVIGVSRTAAARDDIRLDLTSASSSWPAWPTADVTYICVGCGGLEACERDPAGTRRVHVDAVAALARCAAEHGQFVVFLSSSHVFDGLRPVARVSDPYRPRTVYGRQKAEAELAVLEQPGTAVLRCSKIVGPGDARLTAWRTALLAGLPVEASEDVPVAPLSMDDAVTALIDVGDAREPGAFQVSGPDEGTYFSMAQALAAYLGADASLVRRASAGDAGVPPAFRPLGVRLEQFLPRPFDPCPLDVVIARALTP